MPRSKGYTAEKRRRPVGEGGDVQQVQQDKATPMDGADGTDQSPAQQTTIVELAPAAPSLSIHQMLARLLWSTDYIPLLLQELSEYTEVAVYGMG